MAAKPTLKFRIRINKGDEIAVGPGKIALLEAIIDTGSITAAAKQLDMSYRRAWLLVDEMNRIAGVIHLHDLVKAGLATEESEES